MLYPHYQLLLVKMKKLLPSPLQKPVLPLVKHNNQWVVSQKPANMTTAMIQNQRLCWPDTQVCSPPVADVAPWIAVTAGLTGIATYWSKTRRELNELRYKQQLAGGDQDPLTVLKAGTERSINLENQPYSVDCPEAQETSAKTNAALQTMFDKGQLKTDLGKRRIAGNGYRLEKQVIEGLDFRTRFATLNKLKWLFQPEMWVRQHRMDASRHKTLQRLTQLGHKARARFELWNPANKRAHLLGMSFDDSRVHNNQFDKADMSETTHRGTRQYQNDYIQTKLTKAVKDGMTSYFNNYTDARAHGISAHNAEFVGLNADRLDARPFQPPANLRNPNAPLPEAQPSNFKGLKIYKTGELQRPKMWVRALSSMRHALLQRSDLQGANTDGVDYTGSHWDGANVQDTTWRGTVHNRTNFKRLRLRPQPGRKVEFLPSTTAPYRTPEAKNAEKKLKQWEQQAAALTQLPFPQQITGLKRIGDRPDEPKDYCQMKDANLTGKNMKGVEVGGLNLKNTFASGAYLGESTIDGHKIADIIADKQSHPSQLQRLSDMLKGVKYKRNNPPVLDYWYNRPALPKVIDLGTNKQVAQRHRQTLNKAIAEERVKKLKDIQKLN
jgi:uncharacterized protein YjbI with pentapeptide repeats